MLIIVCGLQGIGKSTIAKKIAEKTKSKILRTDAIRKSTIKNPSHTEQERKAIYKKMFLKAEHLIKSNKNVLLDATFAKKSDRVFAQKIAKKYKLQFILVEVICDENVAQKRIHKRWLADRSQARYEQYLRYKSRFNKISEKHIVINNSGTLKESNKQINKYFGGIK